MGRKGAWILVAALTIAIYAAPASAQVSVAVGVGAPQWGASVIVGGPPGYVVDPYYAPYGPYPYYPYYVPYSYYPYAVPYGRVYYRGRPYYYGGHPVYYSRGPARAYRAGPARAYGYGPGVHAGGRVSPGHSPHASGGHRH
jgi:hypothetical protein